MAYFTDSEYTSWRADPCIATEQNIVQISPDQLNTHLQDLSGIVFNTPTTSTGPFTYLLPSQLAKLTTSNVSLLFSMTSAADNSSNFIYDESHNYISLTQISSFNASQMHAIPAQAIASHFFNSMSPTQINMLVSSQLTALTPSDVCGNHFLDFSANQIAMLPNASLSGLSSSQILSQLTYFDASQVQYLMSDISGGHQNQFATADISGLLFDALHGGILASQLTALDASEVQHNFASFSEAQIQTFTQPQLSGLNASIFNTIPPEFTKTQIQAFTSSQIFSLDSSSVKHYWQNFSAIQFNDIKPSNLPSSTSIAEKNYLETMIQAITPVYLNNNFAELSYIFNSYASIYNSPGLFTYLSATQLAGLSYTNIATLFAITSATSYTDTDYIYDPSHHYINGSNLFNQIQIKAIPANAIARNFFNDCDFLTPYKVTWLTSLQLTSLSPTQVAARFADFSIIQKRLLDSDQLSLTSNQSQINNLVFSQSQLQLFTATELSTWTPTDVATNWGDISHNQVTMFAPSQLANLSSLQISSELTFFNPAQVQYLMSVSATHANNQFDTTNTDIASLLFDAHNGGILVSQISTLTPPEVNTNWGYFSNPQIKTFSDHQLSALSSSNITSKHQVFTPSQVHGLWGLTDGSGNPAFKFLTTDISGLLNTQLTDLEPLQIAGDMVLHTQEVVENMLVPSFISVSSLIDTQLQSLSPDQLTALTANQVATGSTCDTKIIFAALTPAQVRSLTDGTNGTNQLASLSAAQVATYFPSVAADYAVSSNKYFTPSQIRQLTYGANGSVDQLSELDASQVAACVDGSGNLYFTLDQIRSLTSNGDNSTDFSSANQVALLTAEQLGTNISQFTAKQVADRISGFKAADIALLSDGVSPTTYNQLAALTASQVATGTDACGNFIFSDFTASQVSQLTYVDGQSIYDGVTGPTPFQISSLLPSQVATRWGDFSPAQIPSFTTSQLAALTGSQIQSISQLQVFSIFNGLTVGQVHGLTHGISGDIWQISVLTPAQVAAKITYFSKSQIATFTAPQLANLTATQIATTNTFADPLDSVSDNSGAICVFDALSNAQLPMLTYGANGSVNQLAAMSVVQVAARWSDGSGTFFTPEQIPVFRIDQLHKMSTSILDPTWTTMVENPNYTFGGEEPLTIPNPIQHQPYTTSVELGLSPSQVVAQWSYFTPHQISGFSPHQISLKLAADAAAVATAAAAAAAAKAIVDAATAQAATFTTMTATQFAAVLPSTIAAQSAATLANLCLTNPSLINAMTSAQITALTGDQIVAISQYLSQPQVAGFTPGQSVLLNDVKINDNFPNVFSDYGRTTPFLSTSDMSYSGINATQIANISYTAPVGSSDPVTNLTPLYPNYSSVSHLAASFISYLTPQAFLGFTAGAYATFTQEQAMYITEYQYNELDDGKKLIINDILLTNIGPITFDLVGLNTQANVPLLFADKMYAPKLGAYDAEVIVHMETHGAKEFLQYSFSSANDPDNFNESTIGDTHLYLDKTKFAVAAIRGASLTELSAGLSPQEYKAYDFSMNANAYVADQNIDWNGNVIYCSMSADPNISMSVDMIQYIADQTFNTWTAYDLFNDQVNQNTRLEKNINGAINATIRPILETYDKYTSNDSVLQMLIDHDTAEENPIKFMDSSNNPAGIGPNLVTYYSKLDRSIDANGIKTDGTYHDSAEAKNLPSCVYDIMFQAQPQRFKLARYQPNYARDPITGRIPMPFKDGDRLRFLCTCNTDENQNTLNVAAPSATPSDQPGAQVKSRTYLISIVLGDAVACGCPENE